MVHKPELESIFSSLTRSPEHVEAIGMITIELANLESYLENIFGALLSVDQAISQAVFFTPKSTRARIEMIEHAALMIFDWDHESKERKPPLLVKLLNLLKGANNVIGKRNGVVHVLWALVGDDVVRLHVPMKNLKAREVVTIGKLNGLLQQIRKHCFTAHSLIDPITKFVVSKSSPEMKK